jgi:hypothetical protein
MMTVVFLLLTEMIRNDTLPSLVDVLKMRTNNGNAYELFCDKFVSLVVGRHDWKSRESTEMISSMATVSDEAFAILIFENNYDVWTEDVTENRDGEKASSKYTQNGAGTKKYQGWTVEGLNRFNYLAALVHADRKRDDKKFETMVLQKKDRNNKIRKRKRSSENNFQRVKCYVEGGNMVDLD